MRFVFLFAAILASPFIFGQVKREVLHKKRIGGIDCTYTRETESNDTSTYISLLFQNQKYKNISDLKGISLSIGANVTSYDDTRDANKIVGPYLEDLKFLKGFLEDLGHAYQEMGKKINLEWTDKILASYSISLYDFSTLLYLEEDRGYTTLDKPQVKALIGWLSEFNKEVIPTPKLIMKKEKIEAHFE